jgi:hypothetical protein
VAQREEIKAAVGCEEREEFGFLFDQFLPEGDDPRDAPDGSRRRALRAQSRFALLAH